MANITPSRPGYQFRAADLLAARISMEELGRIILTQSEGDDQSLVLALLAGILKTQRRVNCNGNILGFQLAIWNQVQILGPNPLRNWLLIQNVGAGDLMVCFQDASSTPQDFSSAEGQLMLTAQQVRSVRVVAGGYFEPLIPPTNPITIFTMATATTGIACEGQ